MINRPVHRKNFSRIWHLSGLIFCALNAGQLAAKEIDCPDFPTPKAKLEWVAQYMVYNGVPMSVRRFDSEQRPSDILAFYRQAWGTGRGSAAPLEYTVGPWQTIGVVRGKCFFTAQVQAAGNNGSTGLLSATQAPDQPTVISKDQSLPMMSGSTVINDIEHNDSGKVARTLLVSNTFSAEANASFYRQTLADEGWKAISSYQITTKKGPGITLIMKRGLAEANLVISRSGDNTTILANLVSQP
jgi:hypothetical protein